MADSFLLLGGIRTCEVKLTRRSYMRLLARVCAYERPFARRYTACIRHFHRKLSGEYRLGLVVRVRVLAALVAAIPKCMDVVPTWAIGDRAVPP